MILEVEPGSVQGFRGSRAWGFKGLGSKGSRGAAEVLRPRVECRVLMVFVGFECLCCQARAGMVQHT